MAQSMSGHPVLEPIQTIYGPLKVLGHPAPTASRATAMDASMRSRATFIRRREFQGGDRRRRVALMERTIADFDCIAADLDREILIEQERAGIHDPAHFAYPTYAKAAILRRNNLKRSADELRAQLARAKEALLEARVAA
jgi:flagellar protein FliJ